MVCRSKIGSVERLRVEGGVIHRLMEKQSDHWPSTTEPDQDPRSTFQTRRSCFPEYLSGSVAWRGFLSFCLLTLDPRTLSNVTSADALL